MSSTFETLLLSVLAALKTEISDYCDLETVDGDTLVAKDGSLATIVRFHGSRSLLSRERFLQLVRDLEASLAVYFQTRGHQLQVVMRRDLDARPQLEQAAAGKRATASMLGLELHDLIEEDVSRVASCVYDESVHLVFWSRPVLLDPAEARLALDDTAALARRTGWPQGRHAQNLLRPISFLLERHQAFVSKVCDDLGTPDIGCCVERLEVRSMLREVKRSIYPDYVDGCWSPVLPGDPVPFRWKEQSVGGMHSELGYPLLEQQLMTVAAQVGSRGDKALPDPCSVRLGSRTYAPVLFEVPPAERHSFTDLFQALNRADTLEHGQRRAIPYSVSFMLESDGMNSLLFSQVFANLLGFTSEVNRNISAAIKALSEVRRDGGCIVKLRIAAMTWAGAGQEAELAVRKSKLMRGLSGWGGGTVVEKTGDPVMGVQSSALGLTPRHLGRAAAAPLADAIHLLPITRPASPFPHGSIWYRSLDGKLLPYERFSSEQTSWITLIAGKPGSGKSVLMNHNNLESCLLPGLTRLPYLCIIDVGVSSSGLIDLLRDALPNERKYLAVYRRLQNTREYAINPFDTALGMREPLPRDRAFLVNFLTMLATPPERQGRPYDGMSAFVGRMIDLAYRSLSDQYERAQPRAYTPGYHPVVDQGVAQLELALSPHQCHALSYWELVDRLFERGLLHEAEVAQRFAVPTLNQVAAMSALPDIEREYAGMTVAGNLPINHAFRLAISDAIADYPLFAQPTAFDVGSARVLSLDLQDVAQRGSDAARKQTALMYMMARQCFIKKIAFSMEDLPAIHPGYRAYYEVMINDLAEDKKILCMDEFHKTGGHELLTSQVLTDAREARKWNLEIILASQLMEDFGDLCKIATAMFLLDAGTEQTRRWVREHIGLSAVEEHALTAYVHGPGRHGGTFLARFSTKSASHAQLYTLTVGAMRLWALSTTAEDRKLRHLLYQELDKPLARQLLAARFPGGTCKPELDRRKAQAPSREGLFDGRLDDTALEQILSELLASPTPTRLLQGHQGPPAQHATMGPPSARAADVG